MSEYRAVLQTLKANGPICAPCLLERSALSPADFERTLARIEGALGIKRFGSTRCRVCSQVRPVLSLDGPSPKQD